MKSRAVVFPEARRFELRELELADPGPDDVIVRTLVTAISPGTERWVLLGKHIGTKFPCVPGYHRIGIVEERGREVQGLQAGDLVYGSACRWKEPMVCMWGAHNERSVAPAKQYHVITPPAPKRDGLEELAFTMLAGVAHRGVRFCQVAPGQRILIIGGGFVGLCAAQLAALRGAQAVLIENNPERLAFARKLAHQAFSPEDSGLEEALAALAPEGFDVLYDSVGHAATTDRLVKCMRRQGTLLLQAQYPDKAQCALDLDQLKVRELTVRTTCGIDDLDRVETMAHIRAGRLRIAPLITHRFAAKDALCGYELLLASQPFNLGIVFDWAGPEARG